MTVAAWQRRQRMRRVLGGIGLVIGVALTRRAQAGVNEWTSNGPGTGLISVLDLVSKCSLTDQRGAERPQGPACGHRRV